MSSTADTEVTIRTFSLADGRDLEVHLAGFTESAADAAVLVSHHGTPSWGKPGDAELRAAAERGIRIVGPTRAGYSGSTPRPGRSIADVAGDVEQVLDQLGVGRFAVVGGSGGGPHSLATAALLGDRVLAAATIAGVAPYPADGLDFLAGMGQDNVEEFGAALEGEAPLRAYLEEQRPLIAGLDAEQAAASLASLLPPVDRAVVTGQLAASIVESFTRALEPGVQGWFDDDLAFTRPWGFELSALAGTPVSVWQGGVDLMVPTAHGAWLAARVPGATAHLLPDDGHLSIAVTRFGEILDELFTR